MSFLLCVRSFVARLICSLISTECCLMLLIFGAAHTLLNNVCVTDINVN